MKKETPESSFTLRTPEVDSIYELVVVASLRARQLNDYPHLRNMDKPMTRVDQALTEVFENRIEYRIAEKSELEPVTEEEATDE